MPEIMLAYFVCIYVNLMIWFNTLQNILNMDLITTSINLRKNTFSLVFFWKISGVARVIADPNKTEQSVKLFLNVSYL